MRVEQRISEQSRYKHNDSLELDVVVREKRWERRELVYTAVMYLLRRNPVLGITAERCW